MTLKLKKKKTAMNTYTKVGMTGKEKVIINNNNKVTLTSKC